MADFRFICPSCGQRISADKSVAGMVVDCPTCENTFTAEIPLATLPDSEDVLRRSASERTPATGLGLSDTNSEKKKIYAVLAVGAAVAFLVVLTNQPEETGWWIFKTVSTPYQFFVGSAFLLAVGYLFLTVFWYHGRELCARTSIMAFLLSGATSILITLLLSPLIAGIGARERIIGASLIRVVFRSAEEEGSAVPLRG